MDAGKGIRDEVFCREVVRGAISGMLSAVGRGGGGGARRHDENQPAGG